MPDAATVFDVSTLVPLPGGRAWTARFVSEDWFRSFEFHFDVTVRGADGGTVTFPAAIELTRDDAWGEEPARA